jgi:hypothetical protein
MEFFNRIGRTEKSANVRNRPTGRAEHAAAYLDRTGRVTRSSRELLGACRLSGFSGEAAELVQHHGRFLFFRRFPLPRAMREPGT